MAEAFGGQPHNREFQSVYVDRMKTLYPAYLWIGVMNACRHIVVAADPASRIGRRSHAVGYWGAEGVRIWEG